MREDQEEAESSTGKTMHAAAMHLAGTDATQVQWFEYSRKLHAASLALRHLGLDALCEIAPSTLARIDDAIDGEARRVIGKVT
jgi:hypothetical protein